MVRAWLCVDSAVAVGFGGGGGWRGSRSKDSWVRSEKDILFRVTGSWSRRSE